MREELKDLLKEALVEYLTGECEEVDAEKEYASMLDDCNPLPMGLRYSEVLQEKDPIAYRCGWADYQDVLREQYVEIDEVYYREDDIDTERSNFAYEISDLIEGMEDL